MYTLWHGDCLDILPTIESNSVDAIFSDPPYPYIKRDYGYWTEAEWLPMMQEVVRQSRRILKPHGSAVFILQPNSEKVGKMRLWLWKFMVWAGEEWGIVQDAYWWNINTPPSGGINAGLMRPSLKYCIWLGSNDCFKNKQAVLKEASPSMEYLARYHSETGIETMPSGRSFHRKNTHIAWVKNNGVTPFNVLPIGVSGVAIGNAGAHGHGAGTPLKLSDWWLRYISKPGDTVLDMFSGTGTTGCAALPLGRRYIGIERVEKYHLVAEQRLAPIAAELRGELNHLPMFAGAA